jgi:predicted GIY-YIG superfamily endonuclease
MTTYSDKAGIYKLTCSNNGKVYIGKSVNLYKRLNRHKNCNKHSYNRYYIQNAIANMAGTLLMLKY